MQESKYKSNVNAMCLSPGGIIKVKNKESNTKLNSSLKKNNKICNTNMRCVRKPSNKKIPSNEGIPSNPSSSHFNLFSTYESDIGIGKLVIPQEEIFLNQKLEIKELEGTQLKGKSLYLNCGGMINGNRKKRDGIAIFGIGFNQESIGSSQDFLFRFRYTDQLDKSNHSSNFEFMSNISHSIDENKLKYNPSRKSNVFSLFFIYFSKEKKKYYIRNLEQKDREGENNFLDSSYEINIPNNYFLIKINKDYEIKESNYIMIGDIFLLLQEEDKNLKITKLKSKNSPEEFIQNIECNKYNPQEVYKIGRSKDCELTLNNKALSKFHCSLFYNGISWILKDGFQNTMSTNGVWIVPKCSFEIYDGLQFKVIGCSKCQIQIKE